MRDEAYVQKVVDEIHAKGFVPNRFYFASLMTHRMANVEEVERLYQDMKTLRIRDSAMVINCMFAAYLRSRQWDRVLQLFDEQKKNGTRMNRESYEKVMEAAAKQGDAQRLDELNYAAGQDKVFKSIDMTNALIEGYQRSGDFERSWQVYSRTVQTQSSRLKPNWRTYVAVINACGFHRQPEKIQEVISQMKSAKFILHPLVYGALLNAYMKNRDLGKAVQVLLDMRSNGIPWDPRHRNAFVLQLRKGDYPESANDMVADLAASKDEKKMSSDHIQKLEQLLKVITF